MDELTHREGFFFIVQHLNISLVLTVGINVNSFSKNAQLELTEALKYNVLPDECNNNYYSFNKHEGQYKRNSVEILLFSLFYTQCLSLLAFLILTTVDFSGCVVLKAWVRGIHMLLLLYYFVTELFSVK